MRASGSCGLAGRMRAAVRLCALRAGRGAGMQTVRGFWLRGPGVCVWNLDLVETLSRYTY